MKNVKKSKPPIKHSRNYNDFTHLGEINDLPSETDPSLHNDLKDLVRRQAQGYPVMGLGTPVYHDIEVPDFKSMDIVELTAYRKSVLNQMDELKEAFRTASIEESKKLDDEIKKKQASQPDDPAKGLEPSNAFTT